MSDALNIECPVCPLVHQVGAKDTEDLAGYPMTRGYFDDTIKCLSVILGCDVAVDTLGVFVGKFVVEYHGLVLLGKVKGPSESLRYLARGFCQGEPEGLSLFYSLSSPSSSGCTHKPNALGLNHRI